MIHISVALTPAEIAALGRRDLSKTTAVVFDILRATSTMTMALEHGATAIYPAADIPEALALQEKHPGALLAGERHGEKIAGFDSGNSPLEVAAFAGREIISTTTNGTVALRAVDRAQTVIAASFLNLSAVAQVVRDCSNPQILLVCAGTGVDFALEDGLAAGALIQMLVQRSPASFAMGDAGKMLAAIWGTTAGNLPGALSDSKNGRRLIERGRGAEVVCCARMDQSRTVGVLSDGALRPFRLAS